MSKKEESQTAIQQSNENIVTELPAFIEARANYYFSQPKAYSNAGPDQLLYELEDILREDNISDEDKQEVLKLVKEVKGLKEEPLEVLTERKVEKVKEKEK